MATEQLYRRCPARCLRGEISEYEQGPNATHTSWCRVCNGAGYVTVDSPNVPAIVAAARAAVLAIHRSRPGLRPAKRPHPEPCGCVDCELWHAETALREALASTVAPLTEDERELLAEVALDAMSMSSDSYEWVEEARLPDGDDVDDWNGDYVRWCVANDGFREFGERARDAMTAKLAELRPELAPYLGVGDA